MLKEKALQVLDELANKILSTISPTKLVVGLSGGADSTLVLLVAHRIRELNPKFEVLAVHCIHGLDADDPIWFNHCTKLCQRLEIKLVTPKLNIIYGNGKSPEDVSRQERYRALLENTQDGVLMLGHQADDQVESMFLALKRGSGPYGLSGMRFMIKDERGTILRPLLELHKREIIEIIEALGFNHVFDISNTYLKFERNFIRLKVLPLLKERFVGIEKSILRSSKLCAYEHDLAMRYAKEQLDKAYIEDEQKLDINKLDLTDLPLITSVLRLFVLKVASMPAELNTIDQIINLASISADQHTVIAIDDNYSVRRFKNFLYLVRQRELPKKGKYKLEHGQSLTLGDFTYSLEPCTDPKESFACKSVVLDFNLVGSTKFKPLKRSHSRELKKLFMEFNIPVWQRASKPIVTDAATNQAVALADLCVFNLNTQANGYKLVIKSL